MRGQLLALLDREDGEPFEEGNTARGFTALDIGAATLIPGNETARIDHTYAFFAAPNVTTERKRLPEGQEGVRGKAAREYRVPKREDIDATVTPIADGIIGHADASARRAPGLEDRKSTRLNSSH